MAPNSKVSAGIFRKQQDVLGVAVRGVGAGQDIGLLRARRHAGRGPGALHIEHDGGNLGEIGEAQEFLHQRNARPRCRGEGARTVPAGADHDADRGQFVLGLHDGEFVLLCVGVDAQPVAIAGKGFGKRRRRRDRIPGADGGAAIDRAKRRGRIALDENAVADRAGALQAQPDRVFEIEHHPVAAEMQRVLIGVEQLFLALVLFGDQLFDLADIHVEQRRQRAEIDDVLEQLALARLGIFAIGDGGERHADDGDVVAEFRRRERLGRIVHQITAGLDAGDVLVPGLRVHRHHQIGAAAGAEMAGFRNPHLVPGRQALDVGGENIARRDRDAHAQHRAGEHFVGARRSRAVDVGEPDDEVVYALEWHACSA